MPRCRQKKVLSLKRSFLVLLCTATLVCNAQKGYVILKNDSARSGFVRRIRLVSGEGGVEVWRTKTDKAPWKVSMQQVQEYAIKEDTFRILHAFHPFPDEPDINFDMLEGKVLTRGKLILIRVEDYENPHSGVVAGAAVAGGVVGATLTVSIIHLMKDNSEKGNGGLLYVLSERDNDFPQGIPANKKLLEDALLNFIPHDFLTRYQQTNGQVKYKDLPALVKAYNGTVTAASPSPGGG